MSLSPSAGARGPLWITKHLSIPESELRPEFSRSSGPGGQNVNKLETRVTLRFALQASTALSPADKAWLCHKLAASLTREGELLVHASSHRERERNLVECRERLAELLRSALIRPKPRRKTRPTRASVARRLEGKQRNSRAKRLRGRSGDD